MLLTSFDFSKYQEGVDLEKLVARLPVDPDSRWVAVKATEAQGYVDSAFVKLATALENLGVAVSPYHFSHADVGGKVQGELLHRTAGGLSLRGRYVHDLEGVWSSTEKKIVDVPKVGGRQALKTYVEEIDQGEQLSGHQAIVYTGPGFIATFFASKELRESPEAEFLAARALWSATYPGHLPKEDERPALPLFWADRGGTLAAWQYDGGTLTKAALLRGGEVGIDASFVYDLDHLLISTRHVVPTLQEYAPLAEASEVANIDQVLDLCSRPGGQEGTGSDLVAVA